MNLGENLKAARKAAKMTQQQVAEQIPIHRTTYTKYETQNVQPSLEHLCRLAEILNVSIEGLLK
ncbi:MAG: helix-turn-helix transcriptional regulator [Clostridia bacterium]|nr:helix-turn-helix transcriptional regulator [Clostridia bacterium]